MWVFYWMWEGAHPIKKKITKELTFSELTPPHTYLTSAFPAHEGALKLVYCVEQVMGMQNESPKQLPTCQDRTASVDGPLEV